MLSKVYAASIVGMSPQLVEVEVEVHPRGLPGWSMVGMLETAVREARERVVPAIRNSGYSLIQRKTVVNFAPGHIKKSGAHFDLPIAIGILTAWDICHLPTDRHYLLAGELSLTGKLLPVSATLLMALLAREKNLDGIIVSMENMPEAAYVTGLEVLGFTTLAEVVAFFNDGKKLVPPPAAPLLSPIQKKTDFADVQGHDVIKRGLEIAAAGGHNVIMVGPPGCGKTMLAERVPTILPALTSDEKLELLKILSLHGQISDRFLQEDERPFRAPHHSASYAGLIGGGNGAVRVGEISLAHHGVLFMDELAEFRRDVLEVLRQPLESGRIHLVRSGISLSYPAQFMLIAAMNPCRCGYYGHPKKACNCSMAMIEKYRQKISGPLLDRIDLHLEVMPIDHQMLFTESHAESSERIRERVLVARERQTRRFEAATCNARIAAQDIKQSCQLKESADRLLKQYSVRQVLSPRAIHRILKVSRTIADLDNKDIIEETHIAEALHYRPADQER